MRRDPEREDAWLELHQASSMLYGTLSRHLEAEAGMTAAEHDVLWWLANVPDRRARMTDLAVRAGVTRSGITRLIDRLERQGWVTRDIPPEDRRTTYAVLTPEGATVLRTAAREAFSVRAKLFGDCLTDADVADLRRVLGKLLRRVDLA